MKLFILFVTVLLTDGLSFGQDYRELFAHSLEENTDELIALGFFPNRPSENEHNNTFSINFESFDDNGQFENQVLTYNEQGKLIGYSIFTSKPDVYEHYYNQCSGKELLNQSGRYNYSFKDQVNQFTLTSENSGGMNYFAIEIISL